MAAANDASPSWGALPGVPSFVEGAAFEASYVQLMRKSTGLTPEELPLTGAASPKSSSGTTTLATGANLIATIIGAGILGFPACFGKGGWYLSPFLLTACAWVAIEIGKVFDDTLRMCAERLKDGEQFSFGARVERYEDMLEVAFGKLGRTLTFGTVNAYLLMVCGALVILIGMSLEFVLQGASFRPPYRACVLAVSACFVPLALLDNMSFISRLASVGVVASVIYVVAIAEAGFEAMSMAHDLNKPIPYLMLPAEPADVGGVIAVMMGGFTYQMVAPTMRAEMQTPEDFPKAVNGAVFVVFLIYGLAASVAYFGFGAEDTKGNILTSMVKDNKPMVAGYVLACAVLANLLVTFPIMMSCVSRAAESACGWRYSVLVRLGLLVTVICIAVFIPFFLEFIALFCSVLGSAICVFLPLAAYWALKLKKLRSMKDINWHPVYVEMVKHTGLTIFGLVLLFVGTYNSVNDLSKAMRENTKAFWDHS